MSRAPTSANSTPAPTSGRAPSERNQFRRSASRPTAPLNDSKRSDIDARSSSMRSRKFESRSEPPSSTASTTPATSSSHDVRSAPWPAESSRSDTVWVRRPAQIFRSVVVGVAVYTPRRIRSKSVAVNSYDPGSPPCRSSVGTSAGSVSVGGSCSYSLSYGVRRSRPRSQNTAAITRSAGSVASARTTSPVRSGLSFSSSIRS